MSKGTAMSEPRGPFPRQEQPHPGLESRMQPKPRYKAPNYRSADKLRGKVALITGGDSGIGRAVAVLFAREGADIAIFYLEEEESDARETREAILAEGQRAVLIPGDVCNYASCHYAVEHTVKELGKLDILVNNAAYQENVKNVEDLSLEQFDRTFRTNIYGYFYMIKAALSHLNPGSVIINCGSITGMQGSKELVDYSATKGAIHAFTKALALNLVDRQIRVNCVAPGPIWTPLQPAAKSADAVAVHGQHTPLKRPGQPEEVAPLFVFLASEADSSYITGEVLPVVGGMPLGG